MLESMTEKTYQEIRSREKRLACGTAEYMRSKQNWIGNVVRSNDVRSQFSNGIHVIEKAVTSLENIRNYMNKKWKM